MAPNSPARLSPAPRAKSEKLSKKTGILQSKIEQGANEKKEDKKVSLNLPKKGNAVQERMRQMFCQRRNL